MLVSRRLPPWLRQNLGEGGGHGETAGLIAELDLETVCSSAKCPNRLECWSSGTATFMILGNVCTRPCGFCSVPKGKTEELEDDEPERVAEAARRLGLKHVVITSVTRDDLPDGGAEHFRRTVEAVRQATGATIEVLVPDFIGKPGALEQLLESRPDVFNHNTETVPRLYRQVRGRKSVYEWTLTLLADTKKIMPNTKTKSGLMLGLGETREELLQVFADLLSHGVDFLTLGQYLQPTLDRLIDMSIQMNLMSLAKLPVAWVFSKLRQVLLFGRAIMLVKWLKPRNGLCESVVQSACVANKNDCRKHLLFS